MEQPQIEGLITKRGAWPDARGRIFLEVDGRVIILADECAANSGDRVVWKGLERTSQYYRARRTTATLAVVESNGVPCQLRGKVAGVSRSRGCFWLQGGQHVLAPRFAPPSMGQVIELYGGEVTMARNYFAGATALMRADGDELLTTNLEKKLRGGAFEADYRALETIARRELGDVDSDLLRRVVTERGLNRSRQRSAHDELLAAFFPSQKDDDEEVLKATLLGDARPGRVDAVVFGTVARLDGGAVLRGRSASMVLKAHSEAYDLPLNASVAIDGCGLRKRPRDQSHQILVAARQKIICVGTGEPITIEAPDDAVAASLFGEVLDVRRVTDQHVLLLVDDVDRGPVLVRAPSDELELNEWAAPAFCDAYPWLSGGGDGGDDPRRLLGRFVSCGDVVFMDEDEDRVQTVRVVGAALVAVDRKRPRRCRAARVMLGDALQYASSRLRAPPAPCSTYRVCVEAAKNLTEGEEVCVCGRAALSGPNGYAFVEEMKALPLQGQHGAEILRGQLAQVRRCPLCACLDLDRLETIGQDALKEGSLKVVERSFVLDDGTASMRCEWRCCGCAARDWPGESSSMDGRLAVVRGAVGSDYRGFTFINVASVRLASEEEAPLWTLTTPRFSDGWDG